jgi:hypothetical protein
MFDYGDITLVGTGGTKEVFTGIAGPMKFRKAAEEAIDTASGQPNTA